MYADSEGGDGEGLSANALAGIVSGGVVFVLVLATLALLLCVCLALWKRRKQNEKKGMY